MPKKKVQSGRAKFVEFMKKPLGVDTKTFSIASRLPVAIKKRLGERAKRKWGAERLAVAQRLLLARMYDHYERIKDNPVARHNFFEIARIRGIYGPLEELIKKREGERAWIVDRGLNDYNKILNADLVAMASQMYGKKGRTIKILDIGAGKGNALRGIKKALDDKVETTGMYVAHPGEADAEGIDRRIIGSIDFRAPRKKAGGRYDLIFSIMGSRYAYSQATVLQRVCNALAVGGVAILHVPGKWKLGHANIVEKLNASGIFRAHVFKSRAEKHYAKPEEIICLRIERLAPGHLSFEKKMRKEWKNIFKKKKFKEPLVPTHKGFPETEPSGGR